MITTNKYGHELVTIQLTLSEDDVSFLQEIVETGEDMGIGICKHIVEQYNAVKAKGGLIK
jgi:hypothetical protein